MRVFSYTPYEIHWDKAFEDMLTPEKDEKTHKVKVDLSKIHTVKELAP